MFAPNVQEKVKSNWAHISITLLLTTGRSISSLVTTWTSAYVLIVCLIEFLKQIFHQSLQKLLCRLHAFLKLFTYLFCMIRKCKLKAFCIYLGHRLPIFCLFLLSWATMNKQQCFCTLTSVSFTSSPHLVFCCCDPLSQYAVTRESSVF